MDSRPNRKKTATSSKMRTTLTFHVYGLQSTAGKCTKIYNARAKEQEPCLVAFLLQLPSCFYEFSNFPTGRPVYI